MISGHKTGLQKSVSFVDYGTDTCSQILRYGYLCKVHTEEQKMPLANKKVLR